MKAPITPGPACRQRQRGAIAIMFGLTLAVLIGFAGLAIDLGRFFVIKSELQNAMDACALAASSQLRPGQGIADALDKARAYGRVFATGGAAEGTYPGNVDAIKNKANFQSVNLIPSSTLITFSETLGPQSSYGSGDPNTAKFAKCEYPLAGLPIFFMRVLNPSLSTQTVSAMAAATLAPSASLCTLPVAVCEYPPGKGDPSKPFGLTLGQWLPELDPSVPGGNFGWIDFSGKGSGGGTTEALKLLTGSGQCDLSTDAKVNVLEPGSRKALIPGWNSRFGIYPNAGGGLTEAEAAPDRTGYGYTTANWPPGKDAYAGAVSGQFNFQDASKANKPYQYSVAAVTPKVRITTQYETLGGDRRLTVAPIVDCTKKDSPAKDWACVLMLAPTFDQANPKFVLEFRGMSTTAGSPCATNGAPGMFGPKVPQLVQ